MKKRVMALLMAMTMCTAALAGCDSGKSVDTGSGSGTGGAAVCR